MKAFEFSLQRLLDTKEALEQAAEEKLAEAMRILEDGKKRLKQLLAGLHQQINEIEAFRGAKTHRHKLSVHLRYLERIQRQVVIQSQVVTKQEAVVDERRNELCAIMRERKSIEKLKDREWQRWRLEQKKAEQKEMDEFAVVGFVHQRNLEPVTADANKTEGQGSR
jgi:flagellar protein FliJ